jgi:streptogrisin D
VRLTRSPFRLAAITLTTGGLVAAGLFATVPAQASATASADAASAVSAQLGPRAAGTYLDRATGKMVVAVTDQSAAAKVRAAGAVPKLVARSGLQLDAAKATLANTTSVPGTAWWVDAATNQVVVAVDSTVTGARQAEVASAVARLGGAARIEHEAGTFSTRITGGDPIFGSGFRCSLGFNVRRGGARFFLTAGHCGVATTSWWSDGAHRNLIGTTEPGASFPGNDYALVRWAPGIAQQPGMVDLFDGTRQDIASARNAFVGESVTRSGSTSGVHSGTVLAVNATVTYAEGRVTGLIRTNVCAEPGDSGGALFDGNVALGLTSGGSGDCRRGGIIFFQPVTEALAVFGVNVY